MLSKSDNRELRMDLFRHLDGIATIPTLCALQRKGITDFLLENERVSLSELTAKFKANEGYLNVALHILASQGWLNQHLDNSIDQVEYSTTPLSALVFQHRGVIDLADKLLRTGEYYHPRKFEKVPFAVMLELFNAYKEFEKELHPENEIENQVKFQLTKQIEGILIGPSIVHLGMTGMFHQYFMEASFKPDEFHADGESFSSLMGVFAYLGWFTERNGTYQFTDKGLFFAKRASAYGVTVSYIPTFRKLDELIFGNAHFFDTQSHETEKHVDRAMNVWGSGGAHTGYFKVIDQILIDLFNKPIQEQPKGILDMGCGNGAFMEHAFEVIERQTERGKMLDEYPLFLVGADYNEAAIKITKANLIKSDIWAKVIWGDIGRPDLLANDLENNYGINLKDLLNVRTFLDHNRIWNEPLQPKPGRVSQSKGAFATKGRRISNNLVEDSLKEHLEKWAPYTKKFGLLLIELHTISPAICAANLGKTASTAYNATHGYSDQYIVEIDVFKKIAAEAGIPSEPKYFMRFPDDDKATVSIHLLRDNG